MMFIPKNKATLKAHASKGTQKGEKVYFIECNRGVGPMWNEGLRK